LVVTLIAVGFVFRVNGWNIGAEPVHRVSAVTVDGRIDASVPEGDPPRRLAREMSRTEDLQAAISFLDGHEDALPVCRAMHLAELGRRTGEGLVSGRTVMELAPSLTLAAGLEGADLTAYVRGLVAPFEPQNKRDGLDWSVAEDSLEATVPAVATAASNKLSRLTQSRP
jgi:hypothetical protein